MDSICSQSDRAIGGEVHHYNLSRKPHDIWVRLLCGGRRERRPTLWSYDRGAKGPTWMIQRQYS